MPDIGQDLPDLVVSPTYQDIFNVSSSKSDPQAEFGVDKGKCKTLVSPCLLSLLIIFPPTPSTREHGAFSPSCYQGAAGLWPEQPQLGAVSSQWEKSLSWALTSVFVMLKWELEKFRKYPCENSLTLEGCSYLTENTLLWMSNFSSGTVLQNRWVPSTSKEKILLTPPNLLVFKSVITLL